MRSMQMCATTKLKICLIISCLRNKVAIVYEQKDMFLSKNNLFLNQCTFEYSTLVHIFIFVHILVSHFITQLGRGITYTRADNDFNRVRRQQHVGSYLLQITMTSFDCNSYATSKKQLPLL